MAEKLTVDTAQLANLGAKLRVTREKLGNTAAQLAKHQASLGSSAVSGALQDFEDHWGRGRRQLTEKADALSQMLTDAADSYLKTDASVEGALEAESAGSVRSGR